MMTEQIKNLNVVYENDENSAPILFRLLKDSKRPFDKFKSVCKTVKNIDTQIYNIGFRTGEITNSTVIDLDLYKIDFPKSFYESFGDNFIYEFNTLTQTTPNGGIHLIFQYDEDLQQTTSAGIDIRNNGGYIVFYPSTIDKKPYTILNNVSIKKIPTDFKEWLLNNILNRDIKEKKERKEKKEKELNYIEQSQIKYINVPSEIIEQELKELPSDYINNYKDWFYFTCLMKHLDKKDLWDKISKQGAKYNEKNNFKIWDSIDTNKYSSFAWKILKDSCKSKILDIIQYKNYTEILPNPCESLNINKLSNAIDIKKYQNSLLIKSDTGTGKTTLFKKYIQETKQKFISVGSRMALVDEQKRVFEEVGIYTSHYKDIKIWGYIPEGSNIVTTIDSIGLLYDIDDFSDYVLFLDEVNSLIEYIFMADKCLNDKRLKVLTTLIYIMRNCKQIIATDADISNICFDFLNYVGVKYNYILNTYKHNKGIEVEELGNIDEIINKIKKCIKYGKNILVCCDTKTYAEYIYIKIGKIGKLYTSDNKEIIVIENEKQLIISPKMLYGNDSTIGRIVFCVYNGSTITPSNMVQQINRERIIEKVYIFYDGKKYTPSLFKDKKECYEYIKLLDNRAIKEFNMIDVGLSNMFSDIYAKLIYKYDCYNTNKYCHLMELLKIRGFKVSLFCQKNIKPNKKEIKNSVNEYREDNFNTDNYTDLIKIMKFKEEDIDNYKDLLINPIKISRHFNICEYFFKDYNEEKTLNKLEKIEDFPIKKLLQDKKKMILLREFEKNTEFEISSMKCNKSIDVINVLKWNNDLMASFGFTRRNIDFTDKKKCLKQIYDCYYNLFGDDIMRSKTKKIKGTQKNEQTYIFCENVLKYNNDIYNIRHKKKDAKNSVCLIEDEKIKIEPKKTIKDYKKINKCKCGIEILNICICENPKYELIKLSNNFCCVNCNMWKCRCL